MPYERESSDSESNKKKSAEIDKKALGKGTIKWSSVSKQILFPAICATHSLWRKNTKVLLPEKKDQGWNIAESSETDPNKTWYFQTRDRMKLSNKCCWHACCTAIQIKYKVGPFTSQDLTI